MTGRQVTQALAFARRKRSCGPFASRLTPQDGRDDLERAGAAVRAVLHVDVEDAFEQLRPAAAVRSALNRLGLAFAGNCGLGGPLHHLGPLWRHQRPQLGVRGQHALVPDQLQPRPQHQRCQPRRAGRNRRCRRAGAAEPKRWIGVTAPPWPSSAWSPAASIRWRAITRCTTCTTCGTGVTNPGCAASSTRSEIGSDSTHWRTGTCGSEPGHKQSGGLFAPGERPGGNARGWSTRCAAVCDIRRAPHDGPQPAPPATEGDQPVVAAVAADWQPR